MFYFYFLFYFFVMLQPIYHFFPLWSEPWSGPWSGPGFVDADANLLAEKISIEQEWIILSFAFRIYYRFWLPLDCRVKFRLREISWGEIFFFLKVFVIKKNYFRFVKCTKSWRYTQMRCGCCDRNNTVVIFRGGHWFESRWRPDFFSGFFFSIA